MNSETTPATAPVDAVVRPPCTYYEAKENQMFSPELTALIRFVRYESKTPCALCGKLRKRHWTMLVPFGACDFAKSFLILKASEQTFVAGTPVCEVHPMEPRIESETVAV